MKTAFRILLFLSIVLSGLLIVSCEPDDTTGIDPNDSRNEYVGVWQFIESGFLKSGQSQSYAVTIKKDPVNSSQVILNNFGNPGSSDISVTGVVTISQIVVSSQTLSNGWVIEGSGKRTSAGNMDWTYSITAGGDINTYTAKATKQ